MSMNLIFSVKDSPGMVRFPYQTTTDLTYAVLQTKDKQKQLSIIKQAILETEWEDEVQQRITDEVEALLSSPSLELTMI